MEDVIRGSKSTRIVAIMKINNMYSSILSSDDNVTKKAGDLSVSNVNLSPVVFYKRKQFIRNQFLFLFAFCVIAAFVVPIGVIRITYMDIPYLLFVSILLIYAILAVPIAYCATLWYSRRHPLVVTQEGISVKEWLRCKDFFPWEEGSYFVLYQYRLPIIPTRLEIFDHLDRSRMMVPKFYDCLSIAAALEDKGIPRKTKSRKWVTWRWW